jgi:hydroxymethylglutaryl-CoA synthase
MSIPPVGISGFAAYLPPYRVDLKDWCAWTQSPWEKTRSVVGHGFRMRGPDQSVYTMAATSAMRLIQQYDIDPQRVGYLALGTESSTDNSAGAVIVKGMLDEALRAKGLPAINRYCEVPEIKHACLGGVYAMKGALRYLALEPDDNCALVISADIAEYERGSSGESTQGAAAVSMLLEKNPQLLEVALTQIGSASAYRGIDFRKPMLRHIIRKDSLNGHHQDHPIFNGKYSTSCYLDETLHALSDMFRKMRRSAAHYYHDLEAVFMHRPYHRIPLTAFALSYLFALSQDAGASEAELERYCRAANINMPAVINEMKAAPELFALVQSGNLNAEVYPLSMELLRSFRGSDAFEEIVTNKTGLGSELMKEVGNAYSAALPAWIAAGLEQALQEGRPLAGRNILATGYGSGDAAEAIPMQVVDGWETAASKIQMARALEPAQNLTREQYQDLHDTGYCEGLVATPSREFVVNAIGSSVHPGYTDQGVEYYRYVS